MFSLTTMFRRSRQRSQMEALAELDDRLLADIGLTRGDLPRLRSGEYRRHRLSAHE
jgi:uncharacterized protein YjiS (DUF1127 family)